MYIIHELNCSVITITLSWISEHTTLANEILIRVMLIFVHI